MWLKRFFEKTKDHHQCKDECQCLTKKYIKFQYQRPSAWFLTYSGWYACVCLIAKHYRHCPLFGPCRCRGSFVIMRSGDESHTCPCLLPAQDVAWSGFCEDTGPRSRSWSGSLKHHSMTSGKSAKN